MPFVLISPHQNTVPVYTLLHRRLVTRSYNQGRRYCNRLIPNANLHAHPNHTSPAPTSACPRSSGAETIEHEEIRNWHVPPTQAFENILPEHPTDDGADRTEFVRSGRSDRSIQDKMSVSEKSIFRRSERSGMQRARGADGRNILLGTHSTKFSEILSITCLFTSASFNNASAIFWRVGASSEDEGRRPACID